MSVEYRSSTVTNMDTDNSKVGYCQLLGDGSKFRYSVHALRNSPFRAATVGLGLLCVLLLAGVIGQSVHCEPFSLFSLSNSLMFDVDVIVKSLIYRYLPSPTDQNVKQDHQNNLKSASDEKEKLQENLKMLQKEKKTLETSRDDYEQKNTFLTKKRDLIQTNNNLLKEETNKLKTSQSQLQASNAAFSKEIEELKASKNQSETKINDLSAAKAYLQKQYDSAIKLKNEALTSHDSLTKERNNLQNQLNNVTRLKDRLHLSYSNLVQKVEHLQDRYNFSNGEKEKIESHHQNLTISKDTLQASYDLLVKATDELRASHTSLVQEKNDLEISCKNIRAERDLLEVKNHNLTIDMGAIQVDVDKLKKITPARKCSSGWTGFQYSCYFTSSGKSNWTAAREYCQNKGADLAIVKSQDEMLFVNGLYSNEKEVWIGLTDGGVEGEWKWVDGTPLTTTFWGKDQPNSFDGRNQDCVEFWHRTDGRGTWNDENCNIKQQFICEK
ncbi:uncharacterized protein LOC120825480 isoform X1 [Gasterosteus aculeatus]